MSLTDVVTKWTAAPRCSSPNGYGRSAPATRSSVRKGARRTVPAARARSRARTGQPGTRPPVVRWIVDPLDGTVNYLYGLADWAVSIAAEVAGTIVAGVVAVPLHGETYGHPGPGRLAARHRRSGQRHGEAAPRGTRCGRAALQPRRPARPGPGRHRVRLSAGASARPGRGRAPRCCRRSATSAAAGRRRSTCAWWRPGGLDAFYERGLNYWDYAAGALIAAEAGARVTGLEGRPAGTALTVAAGPGLYEQLTASLASLNPERDA